MAAEEVEVETSVTSSGGWEAIGTGAPPSPRSSVDTCALVDRYTEWKLLGEPDSAGGGVQRRALVFSAKKVEGTTVCLKVLLDYTGGGDGLLLHKLHREWKALSEAWAAHPHILRIHDKFTAQPHPELQGHLHSPVPWDALRSKANAVVYTEVEPISGSLEGLVAARRRSGRSSPVPIISTDELTVLLSGGLQALQHLHRHHISHRDIKPDNILVCGDPIVDLKFSDFGCCFAAADHGGTWGRWSIPVSDRSPDGGGLGGALESLAPEVRCHIGQPHAIVTFEKNDVWAFGRALHVASCPEPGMEPYGDGQFISNETFREPPLGYIDSLSGKLLRQMLQVQAEERLPVDVAGLHAYKRDEDASKRIAAHMASSLTVAAESLFEPLVEFLNDPEAEVRREGMLAVPRLYPLTSPARMATAVQHLTDPAPQMRRAAAAVLLHALKAQTVGGATSSSVCMTEEQWEELFERASNGVESELQQQKQQERAAAEALAQPLETAWRNEETLAEQLEEAVRQRDEALAQREEAVRQKDEALAQQLLTERQKDDALEQRDEAVRQKDDALAQKLEAVRQRDEALAHQQESFAQQEAAVLEAVCGRDEALAKQEEAVRQRDEALAQQLLTDRQKDEAVAQLQEAVHQKDDALAQKLEAVRRRDEALARQQDSFAQQEEAVLETVRGRDEALAKQEEAVRQRDEALAQQLLADRQKDEAVAQLQETVHQKDDALAQKLEAVRQRDEALAQQQESFAQQEEAVLEAVRGRDEALAKQEQAVRERDEAGAQREEAVRQREEALAQQRMTDRQKHDAVARLQQAVRQKDELAQKLEAVRQRDEALAQQQDAVRQLEAARQKNGMGRTIENMQLHDAVVKAGIHLQAMEERVIGVAKSSE